MKTFLLRLSLCLVAVCGVANAADTVVAIGTGTTTSNHPLYTLTLDSRSQALYLASEIGTGGTIWSLSLNVALIPPEAMTNWTIRMKHTDLTSFPAVAFEDAGWTTVYSQATEPAGVAGWRTYRFTTPFVYDGTSNLLIDFSHRGSSSPETASALCYTSDVGANRFCYADSNGSAGDPLTWSGTGPFVNHVGTAVPNIRLDFADTPAPVGTAIEAVVGTVDALGGMVIPMYGAFHDTRTQVIYLADEIGTGGRITALSLNVRGASGDTMSKWTIRLKHTTQSSYSAPSFDDEGWTTVYQADELVDAADWHAFAFTTPFEYDGTSNLLVDFSINGTSTTGGNTCCYTELTENRMSYGTSNSTAGDPLTWTTGSPTNSAVMGGFASVKLTFLVGTSGAPAPTIAAITPATGANTGSVSITNLSGTGFLDGARVKLVRTGETAIVATGVTVVSGTEIRCAFDLTDAEPGAWDVVLTNSDWQRVTLPGGFTVTGPAPTVTSISPVTGTTAGTVAISNLAGTGFQQGATVRLRKTDEGDIVAAGVTVISRTQIACTLNLVGAANGDWDVVVTNPDAKSATLAGGFSVTDEAAVADVVIGTGTGLVNFPMYTSSEVFRTQMICLAGEVGTSGRINSLALKVVYVPAAGVAMTDWTIRMKHTEQSSYTTNGFEATGWTTVYHANETVGATGWCTFTFSTPFDYNGTSNLMVDFSFRNEVAATGGSCARTALTEYRVRYGSAAYEDGDPLSWSDTSGSNTLYFPNLRLAVVPGAPAPTVTAITPHMGENTGSLSIRDLVGTGFLPGASVRLVKAGQGDIVADDVALGSTTQITCAFDLTGAAAGDWDVVVTNADGKSGSLAAGFSVTDRAIPTITWPLPASVAYGTALSAIELNATADTAGTFAYDPAPGTVLHAGTHTLTATFTPTDTANWVTVTGQVQLTVVKATLLATAEDAARSYGEANPGFTVTCTGFVNGDTDLVIDTPPTGSSTATADSNVGDYAITAAGGADSDYAFDYADGTLTVTKAGLTVKADDASRSAGQANPAFTCTPTGLVGADTLASIGLTVAYACSADSASEPGTYAITPSGAATTANYTVTYVPGVLTVLFPAPEVMSIDPERGANNATVDIGNLAGANFQDGASVKLVMDGQADIDADEVVVWSATQIVCTFDLAGAAPGDWDVVVTNPDSRSGTLVRGFRVAAAVFFEETFPTSTFDYVTNWSYPAYNATVVNWPYSSSPYCAKLIRNGYSVLTSKKFDLSTGSNVFMTFKLRSSSSTLANTEYLTVSYSDSGGSLRTLWMSNTAGYTHSTSFTNISVALPAEALHSQFYFRFAPSLSSTSYSFYVDDIRIANAGAVASVFEDSFMASSFDAVKWPEQSNMHLNSVAPSRTIPYAAQFYGTASLASQTLDLSAYESAELTFWCLGRYTEADDSIVVEYWTGTAWQSVLTVLGTDVLTSFRKYTVSFAASQLHDSFRLRFSGVVPGLSDAMYVDDVSLVGATSQEPPERPTPVITWATPDSVVYGTALSATQLGATSGTAGTFYYNPPIGTVLHAGSHTLAATFIPADPTSWKSTTAQVTLVVSPVTLLAKGDNASRAYGEANPEFTVTCTGFVNGDTVAVLDTLPTVATAATSTSPVGTYGLVPSGGADGDYSFTYENGTLTVTKGVQTIDFAALSARTYGDAAFALTASATSGLPVSFASSDTDVATVSEGVVTILAAGEADITASQSGDDNWNAASDVVQKLTVNKAGLTVTADDASRRIGQANPAFSCTPTGLVGTDTLASIGLTVGYTCLADVDSPVGPYPITPTGAATTANYAVAYVPGTLTVVPKKLPAITWATPDAIVYGTALSATQLNATADTAGTFAYDPAVGMVLHAGARTLSVTFTPDDPANWTTATAEVELTVTKVTLTATASDGTRLYGAENPDFTVTCTGFVNGDTVDVLDTAPGATTPATTASDVGTYDIVPADGSDDDYDFSYAKGTLTVTPTALTCTADDQTRPYGAANPELTITYTGLGGGDAAPAVPPTAACTAGATSVPGDYPITLVGGSDPNYDLTLVGGTLTVTKADQTIDFAALVAKTYGDGDFALAAAASSGLGVSYASSDGNVVTVTDGTVHIVGAGSADITASQSGDGNWNTADNVVRTLTVNQAALTITADDATRRIGRANPDFTCTPAGLVGTDTLGSIGITVEYACDADEASLAGTYSIRPSSEADPTNYQVLYVAGTLTVTEKDLPIISWPAPASIVYGTALSDIQLNATTETPGSFVYTPPADTVLHGGTHTLSATFTPEDDANYATVTTEVELTVTKVTLAATASDESRVYGQENPDFTVTCMGFVNGDTAAVLDTAPGATTPATTASDVGTYDIVPADGADVDYDFTYVKGTLTVTRAALTCTADGKTRPYGTANPELTITYTGLVNGDTAPATPPAIFCPADGTSVPGDYPITLVGGSDPNYDLTLVDGILTVTKANQSITFGELAEVTYGDGDFALGATASSGLGVSYASSDGNVVTVTDGTVHIVGAGSADITASQSGDGNWNAADNVVQTLTVNQAELTITADDAWRRVEQANPDFTCTPVGLVGTDTLGSIGVAVEYACDAVEASPAGTYSIRPSSETDPTDYQVSYVAGTLTVAARDLPTIIWPAPASIIYGTALSDTQLDATTETPGSFVYTPPADTVLHVGTHTLSATFTPEDGVNYATVTTEVELTVTTATLTATARDESRAYGQGNPDFTVICTGFVNGDTVAVLTEEPAASTFATTASDVGTYDIDPAGGAGDDYDFVYAKGTLTVTPAALTCTADGKTRPYGAPNPELTITYTGLVNGDTAPATLPAISCTADGTSVPGDYPITLAGGSDPNYDLALVNGILTVTKANQSITFGELAEVTYGDGDFALAATASSGLGVSYASSDGNVVTVTDGTVHIVGAGSADITASQSGDGNWNAAANVVQTLVVNQALLVATATDETRAYGVANPDFTVTCTGFVNGETVAVLEKAPIASTDATPASDTGTYAIVPSGGIAANYCFSYVNGTLTVIQADQAITFGSLDEVTYGDASFVLGGLAGSGLAVSYASDNPTVAEVDGNTVTIVSAGTAIITASQDGDGNWNAAPPVPQELVVGKALLTATADDKTRAYGEPNPALTVTCTGFVNGDLPAVLDLAPGATTEATPASVPGTYQILAAGGDDDDYEFAYVEGTLTVTKADQAITFAELAEASYDDAPITLAATASSGLPVAYASSNPAVAMVSGNTLTIMGAGTATITASQDGNTLWFPAPDVQRSLLVGRAPVTVTVGSGQRPYSSPMHTERHDSRSQSIYLAEEIGISGQIRALGLNVVLPPGQTMEKWTIRVKQTPLASYSGVAFEDTGWTTAYQADETVSQTGWRVFHFATPFDYDGVSNLMVDFSHNNTSATTSGMCLVTTTQDCRTSFARSNSESDDPLAWSGATPTTSNLPLSLIPNVRLTILAGEGDVPPPTVDGVDPATAAHVGTVAITSLTGGYFQPEATVRLRQAGQPDIVATDVQVASSSQLACAFDLAGAATGPWDVVVINCDGQSGVLPGGFVITTETGDGRRTYFAESFPDAVLDAAKWSAAVGAEVSGDGYSSAAYSAKIWQDGASTLQTVALDLSTGTDMCLSFRLRSGSADLPATDCLRIDYLADDASTRTVWRSDTAGYIHSTTFASFSVCLPADALHAGFSFGFAAETSAPGDVFYIDDIRLVGTHVKTPQSIDFADLSAVTYGASTFTLSASATSGLPVSFSSSNPEVATVAGTTVTITGAGETSITASQAGDLDWLPAADVARTLVVNPAALTVTADDASRRVGQDNPDFTVTPTGLVYGDTLGSIGLDVVCACPATPGSPAGEYAITPSGDAATDDYTVSYVPGKLTVIDKDVPAIVWLAPDAIVYGTVLSGIQLDASAGIEGTFAYDPAAGTVLHAGTHTLTVTFTPADTVNWSSQTAQVQLTVDKATLTATATDASRAYGQANPDFLVTCTGFVNGETAAVLSQAPVASSNGTVVSPPGTYDIIPAGGSADDYDFAYVNAKLTVVRAVLTVTGAVAQDKVYDRTDLAAILGATLVGVVDGDDVSLANATVGTFLQATVGTGIGVTPDMGLVGDDAASYTLVQPDGLTADIARKELTVTGAVAQDKTYDGTDVAVVDGAALVGVVDGDEVTLVDAAVGTFARATAGPGIAVATAMSLAGAAAPNYVLLQPEGLTAAIAGKELTVTGAVAQDKVYDGTDTATVADAVLSGVVGDDDVSLADSVTGTFATTSVGTGIPVDTAMTLAGTAAGNYTLVQPVGLVADIRAKGLLATGAVAQDKVYDGSDAATIVGATLSGVVGDDDVYLVDADIGVFAKATADAGIAVDTAMTLAGTAAGNYTLDQPAGLTADITRKELTVTADDAARLVGEANPAFTGMTEGLVAGETPAAIGLEVGYVCAAVEATAAGTYPIVPNGPATTENYTVLYRNGSLRVSLGIIVRGNGNEIVPGDDSPSVDDQTDFGTVTVGGAPCIQTYTIHNPSHLDLVVTDIAVNGSAAAEFAVSGISFPATIGSDSWTTFILTFAPTAAGVRTAAVAVANSVAARSPYEFAIQGTGTWVPVVADDSYRTGRDLALTVSAPGLLGNDTDGDGDTLRAVKASDPVHGALALNADGSFTYTPEAGFVGSDSFTYRANDSEYDSALATVSITVLPTYAVTFDLGEHGARTGGGELVQTVMEGDAAIAPELVVDHGWQFLDWSADFSAVTGSLAVAALYEEATYALTVVNGSGTDDYLENAVVPVEATTAPTGSHFLGWTVSPAADAVNLADPAASSTSFTMPDHEVTLTATYEYDDAEWTLALTVTGTATSTLTVGMHLAASDGWDAGLDEAGSLPDPGQGCLLIGDSPAITDLCAVAESADFVLAVNAEGGAPVTVSWDPSGLPTGKYLTLYEVVEAASGPDRSSSWEPVGHTALNMGATASVEIPAGATRHYVLHCGNDLLYDLPFAMGWNLVSLPIQPDDPTPCVVFGDERVCGLADGAYVSVGEIVACVGYWVRVDKPTVRLVAGKPVTQTELSLEAGWNLRGTTSSCPVPSGGCLCGTAYLWDAERLCYEAITELLPGRAYWFYASEKGTVSLH